jgi:hypothetical protein
MPIGDIILGQCEEDSAYNLLDIYNNTWDEDDTSESPLNILNTNCKYYTTEQFRNCRIPQNNPLSTFCINCRSLNSNIDKLRELMIDTSLDNFQFDVVGITETFKIHNELNYDIPGYHPLQFNTRADDDRQGGVGLYIKDNIKYIQRNDLSVFIPHVFESLFVEIHIKKHSKLIIGVIYRPNTPPNCRIK